MNEFGNFRAMFVQQTLHPPFSRINSIFTSWQRHPQTFRNDQWSWCADHGPSSSNSDEDHGWHYSLLYHIFSYRIFFRRFRSSRRLAWRLLATICLYFPVSTSFCLFKNHSGMLYCRGLEITAISLSISSLLSSPALNNHFIKKYQVPLANIDFSLLAHSSGKTTTNTLDRGQSVDNLLLSIDVSVEHTENVLELSLVNKSLRRG